MSNNRVPLAILCCFFIAFVLQGILKLSGVFIFEKALDWDIFAIIDNTLWLDILFNSIINIIAVYCLSFALTTRPYSNKWYHYVIIALSSVAMITLKLLVDVPVEFQFLIDIYLYIIVPLIINLTTSSEYKAFKNKSFAITLTIQIMLYFCYLGLCYWSSLLNSILLIEPTQVCSMTSFLIFIEVYIGLVVIMLCCNILLSKIKKGVTDMIYPQNIASEDAKKKELERVKAEKESKKANKNGKSFQLKRRMVFYKTRYCKLFNINSRVCRIMFNIKF